MKSARLFIIPLMTVFTLVPCCSSNRANDRRETADTGQVVAGNTRFALDLYGSLHSRRGNLFFSPYSISTALAMTYAGARGETADQMAAVLYFTQPQERLHPALAALKGGIDAEAQRGKIQLSTANALWAEKDYTLLKDFIRLTEKNYGAHLNRLDFKNSPGMARTRINRWVEEETNNKIRDLIKPGVLTPLTRLVLTNAIYFKGNWKNRFKESATRDAPFWVTPDRSAVVPLMIRKGDYRYGESDQLKILELPYVGGTLSMIVLLPTKTGGLSELEASLTVDTFNSWLALLRKREVRVFLPRFKMTSEFSLELVLASLGMPLAFTTRADFSGMTGNRDLFISAAIHKAFIDVNEEGTEAAAATAMTMRMTAMPAPPPEFRADHPFLFLIRHNPSKSILFMGRVTDPVSQ